MGKFLSYCVLLQLQPEPPHFYRLVQQPGQDFLKSNPNPKKNEWKNYWTRILPDLYRTYSGLCAYSCHWISPDTGAKSVEHFKPKKYYPRDAYRWDNYRLVCGTLNGRKGDYEDVLDPFTLSDGWFAINFPSLLIYPGKGLLSTEVEQVKMTINRLRLNDEGTCLQARINWVRDYITVPFPFSHLEKKAPFIASELKRQNMIETIRNVMRF
jgi:hypothetical protein